jgi:ATP-dependent HslUV protease, peptidase subunit HslV
VSVEVAVRRDGVVALAYDSLWTCEGRKQRTTRAKVLRCHRLGLFYADGQSLSYAEVLFEALCRAIDEHGAAWPTEFCRARLTAAARSELDKLDAVRGSDSWSLVIWRGRYFNVYSRGEVFEDASPIATFGSGGRIAEGAAHALLRHTDLDAHAIAKAAARVACAHVTTCGPPVRCVTAWPKEGVA